MRSAAVLAAGAAVLVGVSVAAALAQRQDAFLASRDHPSIKYATGPVTDPVSQLNRKIQDGNAQLTFDRTGGYLRSALEALNVPTESQVTVFSETSSQASLINPRNPRAIFFGDTVSVGWVRGADALEVAAQDPQQGVIFYTLAQTPADKPQFQRNNNCLTCHLSWDTLGVPGVFVLSTFPMPDDPYAYATGFVSDHRSPLEERWGGWYVTGHGPVRHMGNVTKLEKPGSKGTKVTGKSLELESLQGQFDTSAYLSPYSDVVALMVLEHQTRMTNLLTRMGWETRLAFYEEGMASTPLGQAPADRSGLTARVRETARDLVDYLLFVDEAPLAGRIRGSSGFSEKFSAQGPRDGKSRSLRQFDLERRLMRYPCSYMIYSEAFGALPAVARDAIYTRMWQVLSGQETRNPYTRLSLADRQAIVEILRETKKDLPDYFRPVTR